MELEKGKYLVVKVGQDRMLVALHCMAATASAWTALHCMAAASRRESSLHCKAGDSRLFTNLKVRPGCAVDRFADGVEVDTVFISQLLKSDIASGVPLANFSHVSGRK